jgi:molybdopterin-binding protein
LLAVTQYTVGQAAELLGVSPDTVRRLCDRGDLKMIRTPGGRRRLDGVGLARYAQENAAPALHQKAAPESAQIEVQAGPFRVVSLISREAADELALTPGSLVVASVKSTNVVVEIPES